MHRPSSKGRIRRTLLEIWTLYFTSNKSKPHPLENSLLGILPPELILYIVDFLPVPSTVLFALSCRSMKDFIGPSPWEALQATSEEGKILRGGFLSVLEKDMPGYIACQACAKLHPISTSFARKIIGKSISPCERAKLVRKPRLSCSERDREAGVQGVIHGNFKYVVFQMTMKRHRLGLDCTKWLRLLSYNHTGPTGRHMYQDVAEARIRGDCLYVRSQHIVMLQHGQPVVLPRYRAPKICFHFGDAMEDPWPGEDESFKRVLQCRISHWNSAEHCPACSRILSCRSCPTEFQFDIKDFGSYGVALIFTKWQALGAGLHYDDPTWKSHLYPPELFSSRKNTRVTVEEGSISKAFQSGETFRPDAAIPVVSKYFWIDLPLLFQGKRWARRQREVR